MFHETEADNKLLPSILFTQPIFLMTILVHAEQYHPGCSTKEWGEDGGSRKTSQKATEITQARGDGGMDPVEAVQRGTKWILYTQQSFCQEDVREIKKLKWSN